MNHNNEIIIKMNRTVLLRSVRLRQCRRNITSEIHEKNICEENVCVSEQFQNKFKIPLARIDKQRQSIPEDIFSVLCNSPGKQKYHILLL